MFKQYPGVLDAGKKPGRSVLKNAEASESWRKIILRSSFLLMCFRRQFSRIYRNNVNLPD